MAFLLTEMDSCQPLPLTIHFVSNMIFEDMTLYGVYIYIYILVLMYVYIYMLYQYMNMHKYVYIYID